MLEILFPLTGELINHTHMTADRILTIQGKTAPRAVVTLPDGTSVTAGADGIFAIPYKVENAFNDVNVTCGVETVQCRFVCDFDTRKRYNFFIDDNIFFLTEIVREKHKSIFDSFYLDFLRSLHRKYGFKVTLNMFYENCHAYAGGFNTSMLTDQYKSEFEDNADWLKLAFHAYGEFPDAPYSEAYPEKLPEHHKILEKEIKRYAGEKSWIEPVLMHWYGIADDNSRKFIADAGMTCFTQPERVWQERFEKSGRKVLAQYDYRFNQLELQLLFMVNLLKEDELLAKLDGAYGEKGRDLILCGTHEQYSYPFYSNYIPEHFQRMESVVKSLTDHGYEAVYFTETLLKK